MDYTVIASWVFMITAFSLTAEAQTISFPAESCKTTVKEKLNASFSSANPSADSLQIQMKGTSNTIKIDSTSFASPGSVTIKGIVVGEINQVGESNKIKIDNRDKNKDHAGQKVKIIQSGKNNHVTIHSGPTQGDP